MTQHSQIKADPLTIARLLQDEQGNAPKGLPPIHKWHPPYCGEIDMQIKANGEWFYQGTPIQRHALVKLFSTILRKEEDGHFYLLTPVEKVRIQVDDAPLLAINVEKIEEQSVPFLRFRTLTEDVVILDENHSLCVNENIGGEPRPYIRVRDQLDALLTRSVFYQLVDWAEVEHLNGKLCYVVKSAGLSFYLADFAEE